MDELRYSTEYGEIAERSPDEDANFAAMLARLLGRTDYLPAMLLAEVLLILDERGSLRYEREFDDESRRLMDRFRRAAYEYLEYADGGDRTRPASLDEPLAERVDRLLGPRGGGGVRDVR